MKLYGIQYAKGFKYGTKETVFSTQKGNREPIADFSFFYYLAETKGKHFLIDTGFRDGRLAAKMGVSLISLVEVRECFYDRFHFEVIGGHTPDSSVLYFQTGNDTYCITGDECYFCDNMDKNIPIGISVCGEKNERFIRKAHERGWIPLPFHDASILERYDRLTKNIVRIC